MRFRDQIDFVRQHIKKNRMRIFTTILATTMGCAFLIVLASIAFGLQGSLKDEILSDSSVTKIEVYNSDEKDIDQKAIKAIPNVQALVDTTHFNEALTTYVKFENRSGFSEVKFNNFEEQRKAKVKLSEGTYPTKENEIVVGYNLGQNLVTKEEKQNAKEELDEQEKSKIGYHQSLLGKTISISFKPENSKKHTKTRKYKVVGIGEKPSKEWDMDSSIQLSDTMKSEILKDYNIIAEQKMKEQDFYYVSYYAYATDIEAVKGILKALKAMDLSVYSVTEQLEQLNVFFLALKVGLIFVGTIAVLIASIGIFNTMTMAVTERTREIGVMKAIGAGPKLIQRLFVMESAYIGILGTAIAIIISYIISFLANFALPKILEAVMPDSGIGDAAIRFSTIPWELVVIASLISVGVAIMSGWRPARKATKIDVIQALHQD
ncbi:ABC transporter permease [Rummeliibacillus sp. TYF005]|uniref:ABC transporter permease n=1 Tax=unclassified Rummeliibacillus TaxID=2622809 RepID=UPI000E67127A|nr:MULTISPECIES: FtsX-like permease family protein [unclassified Rummeliibacillus]RIJ63292.1 ABC transporter permease [Rummeliibacillus sp. POC4]RPJ94293.1 ABC transporter permease [Rummeliibacillus sp. TYF005]